MLELAGLFVLGFMAQWLAWRIKVPAILPLIVVGLLVGPFSILWTESGQKFIDGDSIFQGQVLFDVVGLSVGLILFEGGLTLKMREFRSLGSTIRNLIAADVIVTMVGGAVATHYIMGWEWKGSLLFGSLIIVTGPTVVGPILRNVRANFNVNTVLKWEGILIDPVGALIAILTYEFLISGRSDMPLGEIVKTFVSTMLTGASIGAVAAFMVYYFFTRKLIPKYLQNIVLLAIVIAAFAFSNVLHHESGLLAVTVMGMILTNLKMPDLKDIIKFNEEVVIILISFLFVMLSSRIDLVDIEMLANINALWLFLVVVLVLRPISVFSSTIKSNLSLQEKLFISWISPRGIVTAAVASIFSIQLVNNPNPVLEMDETFMLLPLTFLIIVGTVVLQGLTAKPLARILGVVRQAPNGVIFLSADEPARYLANILKKNNIPTLLADTSRANTSSAQKAGFYTYQGSLLGEEVWEKLDFSQFGQLFAMTPNIEINQLTCRALAQEFGSERVFRLIDGKEAKAEKLENYEHHILLGGQADFIHLAHTIRKNPEPQMLTLESAEQLPKFLEEHKKDILPLFVVHQGARVSPVTHGSVESSGGDVFYYLKK